MESRAVVMCDPNHGLFECSTFMNTAKIPHMILRAGELGYTRIHGQVHHCTLPTQAPIKSIYADEHLIECINDETSDVPVVLYNSNIPEGLDLFGFRYIHILSMHERYTKIQQMSGRINRMCHTTIADKEAFLYGMDDTDELETYQAAERAHTGWPCLNESIR